MPQPLKLNKLKCNWLYEDPQHLLEHLKKKMSFFIIEDWNAKVGSQEMPGITDKFGLGVQNEAGQRQTVLSREYAVYNKHHFPTTWEMNVHMDITRWLILKSDYLIWS